MELTTDDPNNPVFSFAIRGKAKVPAGIAGDDVSKSALTVSPSPIRSRATITLPSDFLLLSATVKIRLNDLEGNLILTSQTTVSERSSVELDCSSLASGIYYLRVEANGTVFNDQIVVFK